jgi:hypothetical protein
MGISLGNFFSKKRLKPQYVLRNASVGSKFLGMPNPVADALYGKEKPEIPDIKVPTIDTAAQQTAEGDRLRRRRGVLANIFGGMSGGTPTVGKQTLGGI